MRDYDAEIDFSAGDGDLTWMDQAMSLVQGVLKAIQYAVKHDGERVTMPIPMVEALAILSGGGLACAAACGLIGDDETTMDEARDAADRSYMLLRGHYLAWAGRNGLIVPAEEAG